MAEYRDSFGRRKIAVSNRVCLCVPRYGVLRHTCASLRERAGLDPAKQPPRGFMLDFVSKAPHDDGGPLTKDELAKRCETSSPSKPQSGS